MKYIRLNFRILNKNTHLLEHVCKICKFIQGKKDEARIVFYVWLKCLSHRIAVDNSPEVRWTKRIFFPDPQSRRLHKMNFHLMKVQEMVGQLLQMEGKYSIYFYEVNLGMIEKSDKDRHCWGLLWWPSG